MSIQHDPPGLSSRALAGRSACEPILRAHQKIWNFPQVLRTILKHRKNKNSGLKAGDNMDKQAAYEKEFAVWQDLFAETDPSTQKAARGLIEKAAYLHSLCSELERAIQVSGAIKIHPNHPDIQKQVPAVKEYARLAESYANIVNKLNALQMRNILEDDDDLGEFE